MMFYLFVKYWWQFCVVAILSYFVGSVNFAVIFSKLIKKRDVREYGSGNPGTTNMYRVFGVKMGALTLFCDCLKGLVCCLVTRFACASLGAQAVMQLMCFSGLFAVLGHVFPAIYRFRGGKGVATSIGAMFVIQPILMACCVLPMIIVILVTDRMSVMSLLLSVFMIVWTWTMLLPRTDAFSCACITVIFVIVIFAHRNNIVRIFRGRENAMGIIKSLRGKARNDAAEDDSQSFED